MTRIMTITSAVPAAGKTQLAINLALEQVRRGRQSAIFYARESASPITALLDIQAPVTLLRREDDARERGLLRSGYQGVDILSCGTPLHEWPLIQAELRAGCIRDMDVQEGYDDFLIDTSGMDPRSQLACCRASEAVTLVMTPEPGSQAGAFALIRVLQLNGYTGSLSLLINKVRYPADSKEIYENFSQLVLDHLGLTVPLLGCVPADEAVANAQLARQACTALYPDAPVTAGLFALVDALDEGRAEFFPGPQTLADLWQTLITLIQQPVTLPGGVLLEDDGVVASSAIVNQVATPAHDEPGTTELLKFSGTLSGLAATQGRLRHTMGLLRADLDAFMAATGDATLAPATPDNEALQRQRMTLLLARLLDEITIVDTPQPLRLQVSETRLSNEDPSWLLAGRYLKYSFTIAAPVLTEGAHALLRAEETLSVSSGSGDETIYELIDAQRHHYLSVIDDPLNGVRIQVWLKVVTGPELKMLPLPQQLPAG